MAQRSHQELDVWHEGMESAEAVYRIATDFPADERFGLTSQRRRAAVSVPVWKLAETFGGMLTRLIQLSRCATPGPRGATPG